MGLGDEIMLSGIARRVSEATNGPVAFVSANGEQRSDPVWNEIPYIAQRGQAASNFIFAGKGRRPYYSRMEGNRIIWRKWDKAPGEIRLTDAERAWAVEQIRKESIPPFVVIEPNFKPQGGGGLNKDWGRARWEELAKRAEFELDINFIQLGTVPMRRLEHAWGIVTPTFRHACAILERSIGYVGHEGGLHHAAAALGKPAVVVFGGYIAPEVTGYAGHTNLYAPDERFPLGCGYVTPCEHCRESMSKITVEQVVNAVKEMMK